MLQVSSGVLNVPAIMSCVHLDRSFQFQMQPSLRFKSLASRGRLLQLPRVEAIITTTYDRWIDIRHSGLFLSVGWGIEVKSRCTTFVEAMGWRRIFIPLILHIIPHSQPYPSSLGTFFSQKDIFPPYSCCTYLKISSRNVDRWE